MTRNKRLTLTASAALVCALIAGPVAAQGRGRGPSKPKPQSSSSAATITVVFHDDDRALFRDYFAVHKISAQPLPPGIAKNVARGKPLPPGIAKKVLPHELVATLGPRTPNVTYYIVGDRVVAVRSGTVIDVLLDIFD